MHLHVRNLAEAEAFYRDVIGFDLVIGGWHQASFLSAGGYRFSDFLRAGIPLTILMWIALSATLSLAYRL